MAIPVEEIGSAGAKAVSSFREAVQDLLVPELRALKVSMDSIRTEMQLRDEKQTKALEDQGQRLTQAVEALTREMKLRDEHQSQAVEALTREMKLRDEHQSQAIESLTHETRLGYDRQSQATAALSAKLDFAIDIRERLAVVEARLPQQ